MAAKIEKKRLQKKFVKIKSGNFKSRFALNDLFIKML